MKRLNAFYFSGTGNTRFVALRLCKKLSLHYQTSAYDISDASDFTALLKNADCILLAFPVYGSSPPVPMRRFVYKYAEALKNKEVIIVITQYMFSGDGAASLGRTVEKFGGKVKFAEHFNMPNNLSDCKIFAVKNGAEIEGMLQKAEKRMDRFVERIVNGKPLRRGFNPLSRAVGYYCQRKFFRRGEGVKKTKLNIDSAKCIGCGLCEKQCPVKNIRVENGKATPQGNCALCYRCVNLCPKKAITLCGKQPPDIQYKGINSKNLQ